MSIWEIVLIGLALSMDALAVSITSGVAIKKLHVGHASLIAGFFGGFQALMPLLGWALGATAQNMIQDFDHWIAFGLLSAIGAKMVFEAVKGGDGDEEAKNPLHLWTLFLLAVATSIDALAVGVSMACLDVSIATPALVIGCITFATSFAGVYIGNMFGHLFERKLEVAGGLILMGIGVKILVEHLK